MIVPTVTLVVIGVAFAWIGFASDNDPALTVGLVILIIAAAVGILALADHYRPRRP